MRIKDLKKKHPRIYKRALECQVEQGNKENDELYLNLGAANGNFYWDETKEGEDIWADVISGNFGSWYEFHGNSKFTDKERLDALQKLTVGYGKGWILRDSSTNRGLRLHESDKEEAVPDVREAIDNYLKNNKIWK